MSEQTSRLGILGLCLKHCLLLSITLPNLHFFLPLSHGLLSVRMFRLETLGYAQEELMLVRQPRHQANVLEVLSAVPGRRTSHQSLLKTAI